MRKGKESSSIEWNGFCMKGRDDKGNMILSLGRDRYPRSEE